MGTIPAVSVIVPVYREADRINGTIAHVRRLDARGECEVLVVDGDAARSTIDGIEDPHVIVMVSAKGRGAQMNAGAAAARGRTLLFLHADTRLPDNALERIRETAADDSFVGGAFSFAYESDRAILRLCGRLSTWRCRITREPFGDQAIFLSREHFFSVGRFREMPLMEDVELVRRIKRLGGRLRILPEPVHTSPRRIEAEGLAYSGLRCAALLCLYTLGVSPQRLKRYYPDHPGAATPQMPVSNWLHNRQMVEPRGSGAARRGGPL